MTEKNGKLLARPLKLRESMGADEVKLISDLLQTQHTLINRLHEELDAARQEIARLREDLVDALDGWREGTAYKGDYLREKHGDLEAIAAIEARYKLRQDTP